MFPTNLEPGLPLLIIIEARRVERWRGGWKKRSQRSPAHLVTSFRCRFASPVSTSRSSNRTGGFPASGSPTGFAKQHTKRHDAAPSLPSLDPSAGSESFSGGHRQHGHSPDSHPLPDHSRSQAPSLHRRYPASSVLRACPSPHTALPVPRGLPVGGHAPPPLGLPVLPVDSSCTHAIASTPAGPVELHRSRLDWRRPSPSV
jgi:hypothetical protein